jgi:hypothetical protein
MFNEMHEEIANHKGFFLLNEITKAEIEKICIE